MQSSYENRRTYAGEKYLRAESLLQGGRFVSVVWEIVDIVYSCPFKKIGAARGEESVTKGLGVEFREAPGFVLGLGAATNVSMISLTTGEGHPEKWRGHRIRLAVRLIFDKRQKVDIPCIRVWSDAPVRIGRIVEQLGRKVDEEWYAQNAFTYTQGSLSQETGNSTLNERVDEAQSTSTQKQDDATEQLRIAVTDLADKLRTANDEASFDLCRAEIVQIWKRLDMPQKELLTRLGDEAKLRCKPDAEKPTVSVADQIARRVTSASDVKTLSHLLNDVAKAFAEKRLEQHESEALTSHISEKMRAADAHVPSPAFAKYRERIANTAAKPGLITAILDDVAADVSAGNLTGDESEKLNAECDAKIASA